MCCERCCAAAGPMYQAGTLSGNPLAMTAGIKTLEILDRPGTYEHLDRVTGKLIQGILDAGREAGHEICGGHISGESLHATRTDLKSGCVPHCTVVGILALIPPAHFSPFHSQYAVYKSSPTCYCACRHVWFLLHKRSSQLLRGCHKGRHSQVWPLPQRHAGEGGLPRTFSI